MKFLMKCQSVNKVSELENDRPFHCIYFLEFLENISLFSGDVREYRATMGRARPIEALVVL